MHGAGLVLPHCRTTMGSHTLMLASAEPVSTSGTAISLSVSRSRHSTHITGPCTAFNRPGSPSPLVSVAGPSQSSRWRSTPARMETCGVA
jgi:hypothetical protein